MWEHSRVVRAIRTIILSYPTVQDCFIASKHVGDGAASLVAYVVAMGSVDDAMLAGFVRDRLLAQAPSAEAPSVTVVTVSSLPPDPALADFNAAGVAILDEELISTWQRTIDSTFGAGRLQVGIADARGNHGTILVAQRMRPDAQGSVSRPREDGPVAPSYVDGGAADVAGPNPTETMVELLLQAAQHHGDHALIHVDADGVERSQTYRELLTDACRIAQGLTQSGLNRGSTVLLQLDSSHHFFTGLWGCLLGGYVPALAAVPTEYVDGVPGSSKVEAAWRALRRPPILTAAAQQAALREFADARGWGELRIAVLEDLLGNDPAQPYRHARPDDTALMFFTSGSTGTPKIVMQRHHAILTQVRGSVRQLSMGSDGAVLNWMPLDHVGSVVLLHSGSLGAGCTQVHVPTHYVLGEPLRWLDLLSRHRIRVSWAPNFAFGLVTDRLGQLGNAGYRWDLSCVQAIINGGEAISARGVRRFLQMLEPAGLPATAMWPAWGMAETCSGVVYSERFSAQTTSDNDSFVEVGRPIAGVRLRIVGDDNRVLRDGDIGTLHVQGAMVTAGYYENPAANAEAFTADGWFNTGDLGFLRDGRLTLTGRAKDIIIINGANFASHEIESVVEELPFIDRSYTAACAVRGPGATTDQLAVFFHLLPGTEKREALRRIRSTILQEIGVNPDHLVPVDRADIPKTGLGKIQRSQLSEKYRKKLSGSAGSAAAIERTIELPAWFYRPEWHPSTIGRLSGQECGPVLIFLDRLGLGQAFRAILRGRGQQCVSVHQKAGAAFARIDTDTFVIDPGNGEHYRRLIQEITDQELLPKHIVHLSDYAVHIQFSDTQMIRTRCRTGAGWVIHLLAAMAAVGWDSSVSLRVVGAHTQRIGETDRVTFTRALVRSLLKTGAQEVPWLRCQHLDVEVDEPQRNAQHLVDEIDGDTTDLDVAYRSGCRLVPRLVPVHRAGAAVAGAQFTAGGLYVLAGGSGGIGLELTRHLRTHYDSKVLLLGRRQLDESAKKTLRALGADVRYAVADVTDEHRVRECVEQAEKHWGTTVAGVMHLAGYSAQQSLMECSVDQFLAVVEPKLCGAWNLHQIVKDRPGASLILFSSATGYFGAVMLGPYAAANAALDAFADHLHTESVPSNCQSIGWSMWRETGMTRGMALTGQIPLLGYRMMAPREALMSLSVAAADSHPFLLVGLDPHGRATRQHMAGPPRSTRTIVARIDDPDAVDHIATVLAPIRLLDRHGTPTSCQVVADAHVPEGPMQPQSDIERRIASVWCDLLGHRNIRRDDDFFDLGGTSLQMAQMHQQVGQELGRDLPWADVIRARTVSALAALLDRPGAIAADTLSWRGFRYAYRYLKHRKAPESVPLVLITGAFQGMYAMPRLEHLLRPLGNMLMADLPGSGCADSLSSDYGFDFLADCLNHLLDELGILRVNLVGVSYGGSIAYAFAQRWPDRINRLAMAGTVNSFPSYVTAARGTSTRTLQHGRIEPYVDHIVEATMRLDSDIVIRNRETTRGLLEKVLRESTPEELTRYLEVQNRVLAPVRDAQGRVFDRPTLVFTGEHDLLTPPSYVRELAATIPGAVYTSFRDADHLVPMECPEEMADLLIRFFTDQSLDNLPYCDPVERPLPRLVSA